MSLAEGDEVPGGVLGPFVGPFVAAEVGAGFVRGEPAEAVVQHPVEGGVGGVDADVLRGGLEDQRPEFADDSDRVHLLPEQVGGVEFHADVGGAGQFDQLVHVGGVEHHVLRVQLEGDLDVEIRGESVGFLPEGCGDLPLVVKDFQGGGVPGVDDPVDPGGSRFAAGQTGHGDDAGLAEPVGQLDGAADVVGVLVADGLGGVQGIAVAVQPGDRDTRALEDSQVVVPGGIADENVVERRDVHRGEEAAGVDLDAGQPEVGDDLECVGQ